MRILFRPQVILVAVIAALAALGGSPALAQDSEPIGVTVTAQIISISVSDGDVAYGTLALGGTNNTFDGSSPALGDQQTITNNSPVSVDISLKSSDATATTTWELANVSTCNNMGTNTFGHQYDIDVGAGPAVWADFPASNDFTSSVITLTESAGADDNATLDMKICMPSSTEDSSQHSITVTVLGTEA